MLTKLLRYLLLSGLLLGGVSSALAYFFWQAYQRTPLPVNAPYVLWVKPGDSLSHVAQRLHEDELIRHPFMLSWLGRWRDQARHIRVGEYELSEPLTPPELLNMLVSGKVKRYPVRFVEGWRFRQLRQELERQTVLVQTLADKSSGEVMALLGQPGEHPEGRFFPDTYSVTRGDSDLDVLRRAFEKMQNELQQAWQQRDETVPLESAYEALILASIVEKETGVPDERGRIAGVFVNRLRRGMRLQTDPTVIYGLGEDFDGNIRRVHLRQDTPYNTYTRHGLPPTPIAMPGREALLAAVKPEPTSALFFVARGDGSHVFSDTLDAHNAAVRQYQIEQRRQDYRSSPSASP